MSSSIDTASPPTPSSSSQSNTDNVATDYGSNTSATATVTNLNDATPDAARTDSTTNTKSFDATDNKSSENDKQYGETSGSKKDESMFECNICLDTAKEAVVSMCGHLFCWPCLHQWLETRPTRQLCPVCKAAISKDKVIPLYGRGSSTEDPRYDSLLIVFFKRKFLSLLSHEAVQCLSCHFFHSDIINLIVCL